MTYVIRANPDYDVRVEASEFGPILHHQVFSRWSPSLKRRIVEDLRTIKAALGTVFVAVPEGDEKLARYVQSIGFTFDVERLNPEGERFFFYRSLP